MFYPSVPHLQVGQGFNRDYWERFERFVRDLTKKGADDVYVVTGPLWMPKPDGDGKWLMQHPCIGESFMNMHFMTRDPQQYLSRELLYF